MHQLLPPSPDCRRLRHSIQEIQRNKRTGKITICAVCTLGYEQAITAFDGNEQMADDFVRALRAERTG